MQPTSLAFKATPAGARQPGAAAGASPGEDRLSGARPPPSPLPEFEALREQAKAIKDHTLAHLDLVPGGYEQQRLEPGGQVHWARDAAEARAVVLALPRRGRRT